MLLSCKRSDGDEKNNNLFVEDFSEACRALKALWDIKFVDLHRGPPGAFTGWRGL